MINKLIWDILSSDSVDNNATTVKAQLMAKFPSITNADNLIYYWTSLKTLLGGTTSDWAKKKIKYQNEENQNLQASFENSELPLIAISQIGSYNPTDTNNYSHEVLIGIDIFTPSNETTSYSNNRPFEIYKRIKQILFPFTSPKQSYCKDYPNLGINRLFIHLERLESCFDRRCKMILRVNFTEI